MNEKNDIYCFIGSYSYIRALVNILKNYKLWTILSRIASAINEYYLSPSLITNYNIIFFAQSLMLPFLEVLLQTWREVLKVQEEKVKVILYIFGMKNWLDWAYLLINNFYPHPKCFVFLKEKETHQVREDTHNKILFFSGQATKRGVYPPTTWSTKYIFFIFLSTKWPKPEPLPKKTTFFMCVLC